MARTVYTATAPDGTVFKFATTARTYTHAILYKADGGRGPWKLGSRVGRPDLVAQRLEERGRGSPDCIAVEVQPVRPVGKAPELAAPYGANPPPLTYRGAATGRWTRPGGAYLDFALMSAGYAVGKLGGNCTGWTRKIGTVTLQVSHGDMDAFADPTEAEWLAGAYADDGACVYFHDAGTLVEALQRAATLPTDPAAFAAFALGNPEVEYQPAV